MTNKKYLLLCIFIIFALTSTVQAADNDTSIHIVDDSSKVQMNDPTIQNAIDNAHDGDTIEITGTYYEHCHFVVDKNLTIISNVGTTLEACPSRNGGSDGVGVFYFSQKASGSTLSGFTFINEAAKLGSVDPYAVYINGASDIKITNSTVQKVSDGPGIYLVNAQNTVITNVTIKNSNKGIYIENSTDTQITDSNITKNKNAGIYIGFNTEKTRILNNNISNNIWKGIYLASCVNSEVISNIICDNKNSVEDKSVFAGTGIYINSSITNFKIKGNYICKNGDYGIFTSPEAMDSLVDEKVEVIDGNIFVSHEVRAVYSQDNNGCTGTIYVGSNFYSCELLCPSTAYEKGVLALDGARDLILSNITELKKGVYSVSFIRKDTGEVATSLSSVDVVFYLNKKDSTADIKVTDTAKIVRVVNGTAIVSFRDAAYEDTNNSIIVLAPGCGGIDFSDKATRLAKKYIVPDSNIPGNLSDEVVLTAQDVCKFFSSSEKYCVNVQDGNGNPIKDTNVSITINGVDYIRKTNDEGQAFIALNLNSGDYNITANCSDVSINSHIKVLSTVNSSDVVKYFKNQTQYYAKFLDENGNPIENETVTLNINGVFYNRTTNKTGDVRLNINLNPGEYILTAYNNKTGEQYASNIHVLSKLSENTDIVKNYKNATQFTVKVLDDNGNSAGAGKNVTFNINGVFYHRTTDSEGIAKLNINLQPGTYIITSEYDGLKVSNNITVKSVLSANNLVKTYGSEDKFLVKVIDGESKALVNGNVTFNINGVIYQRTTDNDGIASLNINLQAGKYIITSSYNGENIANTVTVKA